MQKGHYGENQKRFPIKIVLLVLALILVCTVTLAYMFTRTERTVNQFSKAIVSCDILEKFEDEISKTEITVKNTGNISAYMRVRLVSYWVNGDDKIVGKTAQVPSFDLADGWIPLGDDTYCYTRPIAVGDKTPNLLTTAMTLQKEDDYIQVVEVIADAIQSEPTDAVKESWNVSVANDGSVISIDKS